MKTLINGPTVLVAVAIASLLAAAPARAQSDERAIVAAVTNFLDGIRTRDTSLIRSTVAAGATFVPVGGATGLGAPTPVDGIIERTGKGTGPGNDERIEMPKVQMDEQLASLWAYFTLTRPGAPKIDVCGTNLFLLRKGSDGWKIFQIAATSRTEGCLPTQGPDPAAAPANPISATFKAHLLSLHGEIAQAFDSIPASKFDYKPTPAQLSVGFIAQHVATDNYLFCNTFGAMKANVPEADVSTPDSVKAMWPKEQLVSKLKASFAFCAQAMGQLADGTLGDTVSLMYGGSKRTTVRINTLLVHSLDLADHYSQLANYMRLNNLVPPSALPRPKRGS